MSQWHFLQLLKSLLEYHLAQSLFSDLKICKLSYFRLHLFQDFKTLFLNSKRVELLASKASETLEVDIGFFNQSKEP